MSRLHLSVSGLVYTGIVILIIIGILGLSRPYRVIKPIIFNQQTVSIDEVIQENKRLKEMLHYINPLPYKMISVSTTGIFIDNSIILSIHNKPDSGIHIKMPVIDKNLIVGIVLNTLNSEARILTVASAGSIIPARCQRSGARAWVVGQNDVKIAVLAQAERTSDFINGDTIVTSGVDGSFPSGMIIGKVRNLNIPKTGLFLSADVELALDVTNLSEMTIIQRF
jgi:rod shape-determining protein MreC